MFSQNNNNEVKLDWMYKGPTSSVDREEYLLGRSVDKTLEQLNQEEKEKQQGPTSAKSRVEHECIPPSIRDFNKVVQAEQVDLSAKLQEDPLVAIKKCEEETRRQFLQNPVQLKKLQKALKAQENKKKKKKKKKTKRNEEDDLDAEISRKLEILKNGGTLEKKEPKKSHKEDRDLDTILMHKFNKLKHLLTEEDLRDILEGNFTDESSADEIEQKGGESSAEESSDEDRRKKKFKKRKITNVDDQRKNQKQGMRRMEGSSDQTQQEQNRGGKFRREQDNNGRYWKKQGEDKFNRGKRDDYVERYRNKEYVSRNRRDNSSDDEGDHKQKKKREGSEDGHRKKNRVDSSDEIDERSKWYKGKKQNNSEDKQRNKYETRDESSSENEKRQKYTKTKRNEGDNEIRKRRDEDEKRRNYRSRRTSEDERRPRETRRGSSSDDGTDNERKYYMSERRRKQSSPQRTRIRSPSSSSDSDEGKPIYDSDGSVKKQEKKNWGLVRSDGSKIPLKRATEEKKIQKDAKTEAPKPVSKPKPVRLTEKEKEKLRQEMMANAQWRDKERSNNVKRYRAADEKEQKQKDFDPDFVHKQLLKSANNSSVESRIKANLNNIQRLSRDMDKNFSRR